MTLTKDYADRIRPLLPKAKKAYGSRATKSPNHDASRAYTKLLVEFKGKGGSLLDLSKELGVAYAGMNRRVTTADLEPNNRSTRVSFSDEQYEAAAKALLDAKNSGDTVFYHDAIKVVYDEEFSLNRLAREMDMSSAHPLYYGLSRANMRAKEAGN
jgi:hypothetical protein